MPSGRRSSNGRATACPPTRAPGWSRPAASRPSTASAGAPGSTRSTMSARARSSRSTTPAAWADHESVEDDRLRLIFTCCHPALAADAQVALTLREVCGLTTEEIAQAFLTRAPPLAQRIVRAKAKIRDARIPYQVPARGRTARAARRGAARDLSGVQRRLRRVVGRVADAARSVGRGDPARAAARRPAAGAGGAAGCSR